MATVSAVRGEKTGSKLSGMECFDSTGKSIPGTWYILYLVFARRLASNYVPMVCALSS